MSDSANLGLPYLASAQAQKHVTMNESLRLLDGIVQLSVVGRGIAAPPGSPAEGARYIVGAGSGTWTGWDGSIAMWADGSWFRLLPRVGWIAWSQADSAAYIWGGTGWSPLIDVMGFVAQAEAVKIAKSGNGFSTGVAVKEQTLSALAGATQDSTIVIPDRSICLAVTSRVITAITGATSYGCGIAAEATKFGGTLGIAAGSQNIGVIGPTAFYADTPIRLTADGGNFTGGAVRIAIHYLTCDGP